MEVSMLRRLALVALLSAVEGGDALAQSPQAMPQFRILGARFISEAKGMFETSWSTTNPKRTGVAVAVEVSSAGARFEARPVSFFLEYGLSGAGPFYSECVGVGSGSAPKPGEWVLLAEPGDQASVSLAGSGQGGKDEFTLLCSASKEIKEFKLWYRHPTLSLQGSVGK
jgi:hypothetical protein